MNLSIDGHGFVTLDQVEPIRELHLHIHEGVTEEVLVQRLEQQGQAIINRFNTMEENVANRLDQLNQKVETLTEAATKLGTDAVNLANTVNAEQDQITAAMDDLRQLAADNPALQPSLDKIDASLQSIGSASDTLTATAADVASTIPDLPPAGGDTGGGTTPPDTTGGGTTPPDTTGGGTEVPPDGTVIPGGDLSTPQ